ncbi:MAG: glutathione transferase GstA [Gammaproteobacteria bacterium]|nr:glutathione transferase GstA [Gammaproteobacteria bacterium]
MKLYSMTGTCSLASNIALREAGLAFELVKVDRHTRKSADGRDYRTVNPKGYVPALTLEGGETLTENVAVLQYIADQAPAGRLAPPAGTLERYRLIEWLAFINSELHKSFSPLFRQEAPEGAKQYALEQVTQRLELLQRLLGARTFLMGETFTVADAYLFVVLGWASYVKLDIGRWPELKRYFDRIRARPAVIEALQSEHRPK